MAKEKLLLRRLFMLKRSPSYTESQLDRASKKTLNAGSRKPGIPLTCGTPLGITIEAGKLTLLPPAQLGAAGTPLIAKLKYMSLQLACPLELKNLTVPLGSG